VGTYAFAPRLSYVPKEFASADAAFWNPKTKRGDEAKAEAACSQAATSTAAGELVLGLCPLMCGRSVTFRKALF